MVKGKKGLSIIFGALIIVAIVIAGYFAFKGGATGTLTFKITDAPAGVNVSKVLVTLSNVEVHMAASGSAGNESENATTEAGWKTVVEGPKTFDLIAIQNVSELLGSAELDAGKYTQIRLNVDSAAATIDGVESSLDIPSKTVKLIKPFTIEEGKELVLTLDFDASESIKSTGKEKYVMNPTIKVVEG